MRVRAASLLEAAPVATSVVQAAGAVRSPDSCSFQRPAAYGGRDEGLIYLNAIWRAAQPGLYEDLLAALGSGWTPVPPGSPVELRGHVIEAPGAFCAPEAAWARLVEAQLGEDED